MAEILKTLSLSDELFYLHVPVDLSNSDQNNEACTELESLVDPNMEQLKNEAQQCGYNQGFSEGIAHQNEQLKEQITQVHTLLKHIPEAIEKNRQQLSSEIADIVLLIVQQFFVNQQISKDAIAQQINQTIGQINDKQNVELLLNPQDMALLQQGLLNLDLKQCKGIRIVPNEQLRLGGCQIRSEHGLFDAGIERQIDNLKHLLLQIKQGEPIA